MMMFRFEPPLLCFGAENEWATGDEGESEGSDIVLVWDFIIFIGFKNNTGAWQRESLAELCLVLDGRNKPLLTREPCICCCFSRS